MAADGSGGPTLWEVLTNAGWIPGAALIGGGVWKAWTAFWARMDRQREGAEKRQLSVREQLEEDFSNRILYANSATKELIDRQIAALADADEKIEQLERRLTERDTQLQKDRDRGWAFARRCEARMHDLYHKMMNARQTVDGERERAGKPAVTWPAEMPLPNDQETPA